jgi:hypothetical protein
MKPSQDTKVRRPDPISMRLPEELKASLTEAAKTAGRSLNAEIRMRLEWSLQTQEQPGGSMLVRGDAMSDMEARIKAACMLAIADHFVFLEDVIETKMKEQSKKA